VLAQRAKELGPPIQMCDALSRNLPKEFRIVVVNCIAHAAVRIVRIDLHSLFCKLAVKDAP
jgi:transposase